MLNYWKTFKIKRNYVALKKIRQCDDSNSVELLIKKIDDITIKIRVLNNCFYKNSSEIRFLHHTTPKGNNICQNHLLSIKLL